MCPGTTIPPDDDGRCPGGDDGGVLDAPSVDAGEGCIEGADRECPGNSDIGVCTPGTQTCVSGLWGECIGAILPSLEECNGLDDDCNGTPDDGASENGCVWRCVDGGCDDPAHVAVGREHVCVATTAGRVYCWGNNEFGQIGMDTESARSLVPHQVPDTTGVTELIGVSDIAAGESHTCAVVGSEGRVVCWGRNDKGQLGRDFGSRSARPVEIPGIGASASEPLLGVSEIAAAGRFVCARFADGTVACWGDNNAGQLGRGEQTSEPQPVPLYAERTAGSPLQNVRGLDLGESHACAVQTSGSMECWGDNASCQLGLMFCDGRFTRTQTVVGIGGSGILTTAESVSTANTHTCIVLRDRRAACFGRGDNGQLGDGLTTRRSQPEYVTGGGDALELVEQITAGFRHTCAVVDGDAGCFGENDLGQLGRGAADETIHFEFEVVLENVSQIQTEWHNTCAIASDGLYCWGPNLFGQIGDGTTALRATPTRVPPPM